MDDPVPLAAGATEARVADTERLVDAIDLPIGRWDREGRLTFCNQPYVTWAKRPREEILGRTLEQIYGPQAWAAARDAFGAAFEGRTTSYERLLTHRGAAPRWARVQAFPDRDAAGRIEAIYTIAFDIHDDVLGRQALESQRRRLLRFTEKIPYPLTYVDREFRLLFVNKAYLEITDAAEPDILGRRIGDVRGPKLWAEHRPYFERALAGESVQYTRLATLGNQDRRWVRTSYVPDLDDDGVVAGIYTVTLDVHEMMLARQRLERTVERDALTDVLSRRAVTARLDAALSGHEPGELALFFVDLDNFKQVNDALGHAAGDAVLTRLAAALQTVVRTEDAVGRFGGDEFIVLARVNDEAGAQRVAEHLLAAARASGAHLDPPMDIHASVGWALAPSDAGDALTLLQRADDAMYTAKREGGDRALRAPRTA
ncbi:MAG TPA: diguanylate cyclase [Burkholderiaceae bacterium]|nr:diguanylate cyclase [Burkholderiaceae bacterium]